MLVGAAVLANNLCGPPNQRAPKRQHDLPLQTTILDRSTSALGKNDPVAPH